MQNPFQDVNKTEAQDKKDGSQAEIINSSQMS